MTEQLSLPSPIHLEGSIWLKTGTENLGGQSRITLLGLIAEKGSITQAAKAMGMSYKAAWDAIDTMNNLAGSALVERSSGGRGGGSTRLTPWGRELVERFRRIEAIHQQFIHTLNEEAEHFTADLNLLRILNMKMTARNQFSGTVTAIRSGTVNDEIELSCGQNITIIANITHESTASLGLTIGAPCFALIKASSIIMADALSGMHFSARNQLQGTVIAITAGEVNSEIVLALKGDLRIAATVTRSSADTLAFEIGKPATALFKASSVILGTIG